MKRRHVFGSLLAAFSPLPALPAAARARTDFEKLQAFYDGDFKSFRFKDWRPNPSHMRKQGQIIWTSSKPPFPVGCDTTGYRYEPGQKLL